MRRIAGGVDANGMLGAAAHLDEFALALRRDAALAPGLLNQLAPLELVDVAGGLGVDELEDGVVIHIRIFAEVNLLFSSFYTYVLSSPSSDLFRAPYLISYFAPLSNVSLSIL